MILKYRLILFLLVFPLATFFGATHALSAEQGIIGVWKTSSTEKGFLHVSIDNCGSALCGIIEKAISLEGELDPDYEHLGKQMIWDMAGNGSLRWSKGKIWDPSKDKTYKSKMSLEKDTLKVSGCILFFCRSEEWTRVTE